MKQQEAVQFLIANAFKTPQFMIRPEILRRIQTTGIVERIRTSQASILGGLMQDARLDRMVEQTALDGPTAYPPVAFLGDLRKGVWVELDTPAQPIDIYRRNLQRSYLDVVDQRLNEGAAPPSDEVRSLAQGRAARARQAAGDRSADGHRRGDEATPAGLPRRDREDSRIRAPCARGRLAPARRRTRRRRVKN